jgi:hypothetical protein
MKKAIEITKLECQSSTCRTPEYLAWHKTFKREFKKYLHSVGADIVQIGKPNHFDISGFFQMNGQWVWFRVEDLRHRKYDMLIRTAKHDKDYTGGINCSVSLQSVNEFDTDMQKFLNRYVR